MSDQSNLFVQYYHERLDDIITLTTRLANFESPTSDKAYVDLLANFVEQTVKDLGASVQRLARQEVGDILLAKWNADAPGKPLLFMMHMDTVWPLGTLAELLRRDESADGFALADDLRGSSGGAPDAGRARGCGRRATRVGIRRRGAAVELR